MRKIRIIRSLKEHADYGSYAACVGVPKVGTVAYITPTQAGVPAGKTAITFNRKDLGYIGVGHKIPVFIPNDYFYEVGPEAKTKIDEAAERAADAVLRQFRIQRENKFRELLGAKIDAQVKMHYGLIWNPSKESYE